jgi:transcriptional regulator with GAF, ATPase, and Fis domain
MDRARDVDSALDRIVRVAVDSVDAADHAGVTLLHGGGRLETKASTGPLVDELDALQFDLREGPCVDAVRPDAPAVTVVNDLRHEQRWPRYVPRAAQLGLTAQMGLRLFTEERVHGGLNLYSTSSDVFDDGSLTMAELFAVHASLALGRVRRESQLNDAIHSRLTIGQAVGILRERYKLDEDRAFGFLVRTSQNSNTKLRDVAQKIVDDVGSDG